MSRRLFAELARVRFDSRILVRFIDRLLILDADGRAERAAIIRFAQSRMLIHDPAQPCGINLKRLTAARHVNRSHERQEVTRRIAATPPG